MGAGFTVGAGSAARRALVFVTPSAGSWPAQWFCRHRRWIVPVVPDPPVQVAGVLANIEFLALGVGSSSLALANVFLNFADTGFDTADGQARVVPEPGSVALLLTALAASLLASCHNRRRKAVSRCTS
jgi:hypothetical protein